MKDVFSNRLFPLSFTLTSCINGYFFLYNIESGMETDFFMSGSL